MNAFCTACGASRMPLTGSSVNLAGQPSKVGGTLARVFGWVVLVAGTLLAAGMFAACSSLVGAATAAPFVLSVPIALVTWVLSYYLLKGGKQLEQSGADAQKAMRSQAVFALANTRSGRVTPADLARAINVTPAEADAVLTTMAKESPDHVSIEVDDNATIYYQFSAAHWNAIASNPANWERPATGMAPNAPAAAGPSRVAAGAGTNVRVDARDPLEDDVPSGSDVARRQTR